MRSDGEVARYYDRNTPHFLLVGGGGGSHSIHRQLWGPDVTTVEAASNYINRLVGDELRRLYPEEPHSVIDMGCGIGGTLFHLAETFQASRFLGITISQRQYDMAVGIAASRNLSDRCRFVRGDFQSMALGEPADAIVAIESFAHSESTDRFFTSASNHLREGGYLMIADDFLARGASQLGRRTQRAVAAFKEGWRLPSLCTAKECLGAGEVYGLSPRKDLDLSDLIRLGRVRDRVIALFSPLFRLLGLVDVPFFGNMIGGNALQVGLREGFLRYQLLVLQKRGR